jgi:hypothetical protein
MKKIEDFLAVYRPFVYSEDVIVLQPNGKPYPKSNGQGLDENERGFIDYVVKRSKSTKEVKDG